MKSHSLVLLAGAAVLALLTSGCGESTESGGGAASPPPPPAATTSGATADAVKAAGAEAGKAVEAAKEQVQGAAQAVQQAAGEAGAAVQQKLTELSAEVKKLIAEGKGSEAMQKIQAALANLKLTPEQQKMIDDLKAQVSQALSKEGVDAAKKAVTDALAPKP